MRIADIVLRHFCNFIWHAYPSPWTARPGWCEVHTALSASTACATSHGLPPWSSTDYVPSTLSRLTDHVSVPHAVTFQASWAPGVGSHGGNGMSSRSANALTNGSYICRRRGPLFSPFRPPPGGTPPPSRKAPKPPRGGA